jgi:hypothetical protein
VFASWHGALMRVFGLSVSDDITCQDDHITSTCRSLHPDTVTFIFYFPPEPLRRGDLLNAINKLAGERGSAKHPSLRRPPAITQGLNGSIL